MRLKNSSSEMSRNNLKDEDIINILGDDTYSDLLDFSYEEDIHFQCYI